MKVQRAKTMNAGANTLGNREKQKQKKQKKNKKKQKKNKKNKKKTKKSGETQFFVFVHAGGFHIRNEL